MNIKICTTIEQSKKLMELGLDVNTADMLWTYDFVVNDINGLNVISDNFKPEKNDIPAWSLTSLLNLLPEWGLKKPEPLPNGKYTCWDYELNNARYADNPVDAAFEMVVWAIENGYIKKV